MKPFSSPSLCAIDASIRDLSPTANMPAAAPRPLFTLPSVIHTSTHQWLLWCLAEVISYSMSDSAKLRQEGLCGAMDSALDF